MEPSRQIHEALALLADASYQDVPFVYAVESGKPGPTFAVLMGTHGNEPVGLYAFLHFHEYFQQHDLEAGRILFILSNPEAVQRYAAAADDETKRMSRFIDINMNRLPTGAHELESDAYEVRRLQEIYPLLEQADLAIDLHSTSLPSEPMMVPLSHTEEHLLRVLPLETVISNVEKVIGDLFLLCYAGGFMTRKAQAVLVECGLHEDPASINTAVNSVKALLHAYGLHSFEQQKVVQKNIYEVVTSVFFPHDSYCLTRDFGNFETITKDDVLAVGEGEHILAPHDGHTLFAFKGGRPPSIAEEAIFLTKPARVLFN